MTAKLAVIADDITGSNATGVLLSKQGWKVYSILDFDANIAANVTDCDALMWNAASRLLPPSEAAKRVETMARQLRAVSEHSVQLSKRIDSTLRGPLGQEIEGILRAMSGDTVAVMVPAFPTSGRVAKDGLLYVHDVPVHETEIGRDPFTPVLTANIEELVASQTSLPSSMLHTNCYATVPLLAQAIRRMVGAGAQLVICDASTDADIHRLADAWVATGIPILPVDPGPFTAAYMCSQEGANTRVLVVSGSLMDTAREQLRVLAKELTIGELSIDLDTFIRKETHESYRNTLTQRAANLLIDHNILVVRTDEVPVQNITADDTFSDTSQAIAQLTAHFLAQFHFDGLYVSGGEVAHTVLSALRVEALQLLEEVVPLCVLARAVGGAIDGLNMITKGGSVGDSNALVSSVQTLLSRRSKATT